MSEDAAEICDGDGAARVMKKMHQYSDIERQL